jgi:hypothetical protein
MAIENPTDMDANRTPMQRVQYWGPSASISSHGEPSLGTGRVTRENKFCASGIRACAVAAENLQPWCLQRFHLPWFGHTEKLLRYWTSP